MTDGPPAHVSRAAYLLGFAGLLPQVAVVAAILIEEPATAYDLPFAFAFGYPSLILSFLGGVWWGFAMRREAGQAQLSGLAVLPSLAPLAVIPLAALSWRWALVALGIAIVLTLLVDRRLAATGEAPAGWMRLRVPLSLGLGGLTILAGLLAA